jgi:hypothetical protein
MSEKRQISQSSLSSPLAAGNGAAIAQGLRHAGVPDEAMRVVQCCPRTFERLVRNYPDEPTYRAGLSEAWTQMQGELEHGPRASRSGAARGVAGGRLAERWPEYRPLREERQRRLKRFLADRSHTTAAAAARD